MSQKILIIEDDQAIAEYAIMVLERENFEVRRAADGKEGLALADEFRPDLVVLDLMMPGIHGYEVCQKLRESEISTNLKILITSTKSYDADLAGAGASGANSYMTKPYRGAELAAEVKRLLNGGTDKLAMSNGSHKDDIQDTRTQRQRIEPQPAPSGEKGGALSVRFWGTRGSTPAPGPFTMRYGGNTSCTEIRFGDQIFIVDCGTGLRELGINLLDEFKDKAIEGHLFVGHTHWDHIQGFPFFTPFYIPQNKFNLYSVRGAGKSLERVFNGQMAADYFPVPLRSLSSQIKFIELEAAIDIGDVHVSFHHLNHPGVAIGFRFEYYGKVVTYISDHETFSRLSGESDMTLKQDRAIAQFAKGSDVLICEAQYDEEEYKIKKGWGHSTFNDAVDRAIEAECKHLVLFHHDPVHTDDIMDGYVGYCRKRLKEKGSSIYCSAAQERQSINL